MVEQIRIIMKAQFLKIAGVKTDKEFYKLFPDEKAFMAKHGKAFKKAQTSNAINKAQGGKKWNGSMFNQPRIPQEEYTPGTISLNDSQVENAGGMYDGYSNPENAPEKGPGFDVPGAMNFANNMVKAGEGIKAAQDQTKSMETWANVSDVQKRAAISNAFVQNQPNQWYNPADIMNIHSAGELGNVKGRGTDVFNVGQNGSMIGGNPTDIQNTYSDGVTLYDDLGYEPFHESNNDNIKQYQSGGRFGNALGDGNYKPFLGGSALGKGGLFSGDTSGGSFLAGAMGGNSSWANAASMVPGPLGMGLTMAAQMFDPNPGKQRNAQNKMNSNNSFINNINASDQFHNQYGAYTQNGGEVVAYENGGYMNPEYNPQVITMFGDHTAEDFDDYAHKYRAGGHLKEYTPPSNEAMHPYENGGEISSYAMGGKIKSYGQGKVEDESYNPYMPGSGITSMIKGPSHKNGGVGISYGDDSQNGYEQVAANGANMGAQIEGEGGESMMEMAEGGQIDPQTKEEETKGVVIGNIPGKYDVLSLISNNQDLLGYIKKKGNDGKTFKSLFADLTKQEIKATKSKEAASKIANDADKSKWGKLDIVTAKTIEDAADADLQSIANTKMGIAESQDVLHKIKGQISQRLGYNISAEDLGRGKIKKDRDPITRDAPLNDVAKSGAYLKKAQNSITIPSGGSGAAGEINEDEYNQFLKEYGESESANNKAKGKPNRSTLAFQRHYHKVFPKEALAAIQKTTRENGLSNKAKQLGLTKEEILKGENVDRILQSNEDEYFGPRTEQYLASIKSNFNKIPAAPELQPLTLGKAAAKTTTDNTSKPPIGVIPLKQNKGLDVMNMISSMFQNRDFPPMDPRQFAGEYMASALNTKQPVPMQKPSVELDPIYRINYNDVRNANTARFRDMLRQNQGNPAADAMEFSKFAQQNQGLGGEEFRANQAIEQQIYGGNRAKVAANQATALGLNANQANMQSVAKSKTDQTNIEIAKSMADKSMKYTADKNKYMVDKNLFPTFGYDQGYGIHTQGLGYHPVIPQIYGGKSSVKEIPVKDASGNVLYYKMVGAEEDDDNTTDIPSTATPPIVASKRNGGSVVKNAKNSSVVKAYKNL